MTPILERIARVSALVSLIEVAVEVQEKMHAEINGTLG